MKIESCRRCGNELEVNSKCDVCKQPDKFFCHSCGNVTEKQFHQQCMLIELDYKLLQMPVKSAET